MQMIIIQVLIIFILYFFKDSPFVIFYVLSLLTTDMIPHNENIKSHICVITHEI